MTVAEGAYGRVHLDATRKIASKFMPLDDDGRQIPYYIVREVSLLRKCERLQIPHIVRLLKFRIEKNHAILDFPLYRECLYGFLTREVSRTERLRVGKLALLNVLTAFAHMHSYDMLYRDCKPSNILIHENGKDVVLADFGGTREVINGNTESTTLSAEVCTHLYAPAEAFTTNYTAKADIYSLGVSVMQIMLGKPLPNKQIRNFSELKKDWRQLVPERRVYEVVLSMISERPEDRPTAAEALSRLLDTNWRLPVVPLPTFRYLGRYWETNRKTSFTASLRKQTVRWICDTADFLDMPQTVTVYMVQLFDEFVSQYPAPLLLIQLPCLATAVISLLLKFYSKGAPEAEELVTRLRVSDRFTPSDVLTWERTILVTLNGALVPRPVPKLLKRVTGPQLRWLLSHDSYVLPGELPNLLAEYPK